jgi:general secretion pathway protein D
LKSSFECAAVRLTRIVLLYAACALSVPAAWAATAATPVTAAPGTPADDERITVNFVNADIQSVIKIVGQHTGRNFILDPRVTGTVNIVSDKPVSKDMLYQILLSTLRVQGYAAVEGDGFVKIVPEAEAKTSATPMGEAARHAPGDRVVTQVFVLQNENAVQLVPVLRPLVTANNFIAAYPNNNAIVITDYASNVERIRRIIDSIDHAVSSDVEIIKLQNASAIDVVQTIRTVVPETAATPNSPGSTPKVGIAVDQRTNSLIVRADNSNLMNRIKTLALGLDAPGAGNNNIYTVFLRNAEAARIAETLRGLLSGSESSRTTTTSTTPAGNAQTSTTATQSSGGSPGTGGFGAAGSAAAPSSIIQAYPPTNSIIITASEPVYRALRAVIDQLDQRRAQVFIEVLVVEVNASKGGEVGVQFNAAHNVGGDQSVFGGTNFSTSVGNNILGLMANPTNVGAGLNVGLIQGSITVPGTNIQIANLQLLARALETDSNSNVLSTPNILTLDNEEAKIVVGQNVPFITGTYTPTAGSANNPFQTIERKDIGLTLRVLPTVSEAGAVKLKLYQEISSITNDKTLVQSADIITNKRSLESTVLVDDHHVAVLAGLIQDDQSASVDKVPLLGDIPYLGSLFRYQTRAHRRTNLMVFLRPIVLKDERATAELTNDRYQYIRGLQSEMSVPPSLLLPDVPIKPLPPQPQSSPTAPLGK